MQLCGIFLSLPLRLLDNQAHLETGLGQILSSKVLVASYEDICGFSVASTYITCVDCNLHKTTEARITILYRHGATCLEEDPRIIQLQVHDWGSNPR